MASQDRSKGAAGRRLSKKQKPTKKEARRLSMDIPERFKDGDDAHVDVTAPKRNNTMSMNQSVFSMIARAGQQSQTDLGTMHNIDSADSDDGGQGRIPHHSLDSAARLSRLGSANDFQNPPEGVQDDEAIQGRHRRKLSDHKILRSLPKLGKLGRDQVRPQGHSADQMSSSQFLPHRVSGAISPTARLTETQLKPTSNEETLGEKPRSLGSRSRHGSSSDPIKNKVPATLANKIQQIFEFEQVEEVISEYPCWLLQSILLQGYMYITQYHICFYAYIPKKHVRPRQSMNVV
jgi:sterol 3beta-glucosyltransferase